jgi:hypothetical protein
MMNDKSCLRNGYKVVIFNVTNSRYYVRCERGGKQGKSRSTKQTTTSKKSACDSELCSFRFSFRYDSTHNQMCIRQNSGCCLSHNDHTMIPFDKRTSGVSQLEDEDLGKVRKFIEKNFPTNIIQDYIEFETGHNLSAASIRNLRRTVMNDSHGNVDMTPVESLLQYLESVDGLEYKCLTGSYDEATDCVTVRQQNKFSGKKAELKTGITCIYHIFRLFDYSIFRIFEFLYN